MELANIVYIKTPSLSRTLKEMPIGREQMIPARLFNTPTIRKACSVLKAEGYEFSVTSKGIVDTAVTRIR